MNFANYFINFFYLFLFIVLIYCNTLWSEMEYQLNFTIFLTNYYFDHRYGAYILRPVAKIIGIKFELRNGHRLSKETGTAVIVANHQSFYDVLGMRNLFFVSYELIVYFHKEFLR